MNTSSNAPDRQPSSAHVPVGAFDRAVMHADPPPLRPDAPPASIAVAARTPK